MGSCQKKLDTNSAALDSYLAATSSSAILAPQPVVNLRLSGNFVILSKSGITDVYRSYIAGDVGKVLLREQQLV